jgi:hypothetical protein
MIMKIVRGKVVGRKLDRNFITLEGKVVPLRSIEALLGDRR